MTIKYVYDKNNSWESSGEPSDEIMFLIGTPEKLPCRISVTYSEKDGSGSQPDSYCHGKNPKTLIFLFLRAMSQVPCPHEHLANAARGAMRQWRIISADRSGA